MQTVGQLLKSARLEKGLSLEQIERATKIKKRLLEALEKGNYQKLPPSTFVKGFIRNYGNYLGLSVDKLLALFRREYGFGSSAALLPKTTGRFLSPSLWNFVQNKLFLGSLALLMLLFLIFLGRGFLVPPHLVVDSPSENLVVSEMSVEVSGQTKPGTRLVINDEEIILQKDGGFSARTQLVMGTNEVVVVATNKLGRSRRIARTVTVSL